MTDPTETLRAYAALLHRQPGPDLSEEQMQELADRGILAALEEIALEQEGCPEAGQLLYAAAGTHPNPAIRAQAFHALERLAQAGQNQAVDLVYRLAVESDSLPARQAILSRGWAAGSPALRALFDWHTAVSSGQPFPPERLGEITEAYFHLASPELRRRMLSAAEAARMKNWAAVIEAIQSGSQTGLDRLVDGFPAYNSHERRVALEQLERLAREGAEPAQNALCRLFIDHVDPRAKAIALEQGYAPEDSTQRALFLFLTENWAAYARHDFDHSLLAGAYEAASRPLRRRLMDLSRRTGQTEWLRGLGSAGEVRWPNDLADADWELAIHRLAEAGKQADLWRLAQVAPPFWSAPILDRLAKAGWLPLSDPDRAGFSGLVALARDCLAHPLAIRPVKSLHSPSRDITCLAIHPKGNLLAAGSSDQRISVWNLPQGDLRRAQILSSAPLTRALALDPGGSLLASASGDHRIRIFDLETGKMLKALEGHRAMVRALALHPNGRILFSAGFDGEIGLWRFPTGPRVTTIRPGAGEIFSLALAGSSGGTGNSGQILISGGIDGQARLWTVPEGVQAGQIAAHAGTLTHLAATGGDLVASAGGDGRIALWNIRSGGLARAMKNEAGPVTGLCLLANDLVLASGHQGGEIVLWNLSAGKEIDRLAGHAGPITGMALDPEGNTLYTGDALGSLLAWDLRTFLTTRLAERAAQPDAAGALQKRIEHPHLSAAEKIWLTFSLELARWRQRFDIELADQAPVAVGEFDIEVG